MGAHDWKPDLGNEVVPITIDVETGEIHRFKTVAREVDLRLQQRCALCQTARTKSWKFARPGDDSFTPAGPTFIETTLPDTACVNNPD